MNILFITADQWRADCLSLLNHPVVETPNIDSIARHGVAFRNHFSQSTPCSPSRVTMHTGTYVFNHRCVANGIPLQNRFTNWAIEAEKKGFTTALFGYTDTPADPTELPPDDPRLTHYSEPLQGLSYFTEMRDEVSLDWVVYLKNKGYTIPDYWWDLNGQRVEGKTWFEGGEHILPHRIVAEHSETRFMVDLCMDWLDQQHGPWVTHLSLLRPHGPFVAPAPYHDLYFDSDLPAVKRTRSRQQHYDSHPYIGYAMDHASHGCPDDDRLLFERRVNYYGLIKEVDDNLGRLMSFLKAKDLLNNTIIVITSDHGEQLGDQWLMGKSGFYDASYHVPLIINDPRSRADATRGQQCKLFTEQVDLFPTLLEWLDVEEPLQCDGRSLVPMIDQGTLPADWREEVVFEYDFRDLLNQVPEHRLGLRSDQCGISVIRDHRYKYVHFTALPPILFDLISDPEESTNLANVAGHQKTTHDYLHRMMSHRMQYAERAFTESTTTREGVYTRRLR